VSSARNDDDTTLSQRRLLRPVELDASLLMVENRLEIGSLGVGQVALRLHVEEVRRRADFELALLGVELLPGQLTRGGGRLDRPQRTLNLQPGVRHFRCDLKLHLLDLRLRLSDLHLGAGVRCLGAAVAERVAERHRQVPCREVVADELAQRVTVAAGKDPADLAAESAPDEFGTAEALHRMRGPDVQCRQRRVARGAQVDVVDVQLTARARDVGPSVER